MQIVVVRGPPKTICLTIANSKIHRQQQEIDWQPTPSAARLAYELVKEHTNLANFVDSMPIVDDLDSGNITLEEFKKDGILLKLSRTLGLKNRDYMIKLVDELASGKSFEEIFHSNLWRRKSVRFQQKENNLKLLWPEIPRLLTV